MNFCGICGVYFFGRVGEWIRSMVNGRWSMVNGRWSMVNGQWSMVHGRWSMVNGQWSMVLRDILQLPDQVDCPSTSSGQAIRQAPFDKLRASPSTGSGQALGQAQGKPFDRER